jgi:Tfp pilus assembly protein PilN
MRPVNLIPPDARRGDQAVLRRGAISYVVIGALALALLGAIALAFTSKQISDRKSDVARLQQEEQQAQARAQSLQAFTDFRAKQETRASTVSSLATSRFDWNRVLNELARVIPSDVWLIQMSGTVNPAVQIDKGPEISLRADVPGPALELVGCAPSQDAVAGFVSDLENIDGVTRVAVASSKRPDEANGSAGSPAASSDGNTDSGECRTQDFISRFEIVVAFDKVPMPQGAVTAPGVPAPAAPSGGSSTSSSGQALASSSSGAAPSSSSTSAPTSSPGG